MWWYVMCTTQDKPDADLVIQMLSVHINVNQPREFQVQDTCHSQRIQQVSQMRQYSVTADRLMFRLECSDQLQYTVPSPCRLCNAGLRLRSPNTVHYFFSARNNSLGPDLNRYNYGGQRICTVLLKKIKKKFRPVLSSY